MRFFLPAALLFALTAPLAAQPIPIAQARQMPLGTTVTVAGFVTVAGEFGGPTYFQDGTAGMAVYLPALHSQASRGDSVVVTGPLTEFSPQAGQPGTGLFQISGAGTTFKLFKNVNRPQTPRPITAADVGEAVEGQLVVLRGATIREKPAFTQATRCPTNAPFTGAFAQGESYCLTDASGYTTLYIDNTTDLVGAPAPAGTVDVVGVVGQYRGTHQVQPRTTDDVGVEAFVIPGEEVPRTETFEVGTWNLEWFGSPNYDPADDALALRNAATVLRTIAPDVFGLEEIASTAQFRALVDSLPGYRGFVAPISQTQKTAIIYNPATVDSVSAHFYFTTGDWASGRYPYAFTFDATVEGRTQRLTLIVLHAKALSDEASYNRRVVDARQLKAELDARSPTEKVIVVGDFNDDLDVSTFEDRPSPYASLVADTARYRFLTASLTARGAQSTGYGSMIDHILVTDEVLPLWFRGTERVENTQYIGSYLSTTSDHYPVWVRLRFGEATAAGADRAPSGVLFEAPFPSPTRGEVQFSFTLPAPGPARLDVFDLLGRRVATPFDGPAAGVQPVRFDATDLPAGLYAARLVAGGQHLTRLFVRL